MVCLVIKEYKIQAVNCPRSPPYSGEDYIKEERNYSFYYLNTLLMISYAGFFAKSQIMFFLLLSFRFCLPLKNDGTSGLHFASSIEWKLTQKKSI